MFIDQISFWNPVDIVIPSKSALLHSISPGVDNLDNFNLTSWMVDADAQCFEPNGAPSPSRFAADDLSSLSFPLSTVALSHLRSLAHQEGFKLSARDLLSSPCIRLYCYRGEHGRGDQNSTKTGYTFRISLRLDPTGNYHVIPSEHLENNRPFNNSQPPDVPESIKSAGRAMAHVGIERKSILAVLYRMVRPSPTPQQLPTVIGTDQLEVAGSETEELIAHVASQRRSCEIFEIPIGERGPCSQSCLLNMRIFNGSVTFSFLTGLWSGTHWAGQLFQLCSSVNPTRWSQEDCCLPISRPTQFLIGFSGPPNIDSLVFCGQL
jgi:hypothetical protein